MYDIVVTKIEASQVLKIMNVTLLQYAEILKLIVIVYIVLGVGIGMLGSAISMKKYLEV